jgi:hypothetical protein
MKPRHFARVAIGLALALLALAIGEGGYRHVVCAQASAIVEQGAARRSLRTDARAEFFRFGTPSGGDAHPSLMRDLGAWISRKAGFSSELDSGCCSTAPYLAMTLESRPDPLTKDVHAFLWSPRLLRFVAWNDRSQCCGPGCPWQDHR